MDPQTLVLAAGAAYGVFGVLVLAVERPRAGARLRLLAVGFVLLAVGSLLQSGLGFLPLLLALIVGNIAALLGLLVQGWAVLGMVGRPVSVGFRWAEAILVGAAAPALAFAPLGSDVRIALGSVLYGALAAVPAWALLGRWRDSSGLSLVIGGGFGVVAVMYLLRAAEALFTEGDYSAFSNNEGVVLSEGAIYAVIFVAALTTAFGLLLDAKGAADQRLQAIVQGMAAGLVVQAADGSVVAVNPAAASVLGVAGEERGHQLSSPSWQQAVHLDGTPVTEADHPTAVARSTGRPVADKVLGYQRSDGSTSWLSVTAVPLRIPQDPGPPGVVSTFTDITPTVEAERQLAASEARFRRMFAEHDAIMLLIDPDTGAIVDANAAATAFYGFDTSALRGMNITDISILPPAGIAQQRESGTRGVQLLRLPPPPRRRHHTQRRGALLPDR